MKNCIRSDTRRAGNRYGVLKPSYIPYGKRAKRSDRKSGCDRVGAACPDNMRQQISDQENAKGGDGVNEQKGKTKNDQSDPGNISAAGMYRLLISFYMDDHGKPA